MENMRNMLHGVVVYVLFFTVQSYEERIFTSETPISDGKNDSNARTGISKEPKYGPRTASIMRNNQTISGDIIMKENTSMTIPLRCASSCNPPCKIAWYINGQLDPRDNPVINIKLDRKVSGVYQCEASGEEGKVEADPVNVTIQYGPITASVLSNNQMISGDIIVKEDNYNTIALRCKSSCYPPCEIAWYRDGQLDPRNNTVIDITLARRKSEVYHCEASGVEGKVKSDPVHVIIQYPPGNVKITPGNDTFYTKRGVKPLLDIICEADCLPECTYTWYMYTEGLSSYVYETGNNLFATKSLNYSGSYIFKCRASNDIRPYSHIDSRWITVEVKDGPDNVTIKPSSSSEKENSSFQLTCHASCIYGCQSYSWNYNDKSMTQSTHILKFQSLSKEDSGKYQCRVTDYFGATNSKYYTVNVQYGPKDVTIQYFTWYEPLIEGQDSITLTCNADCNPECSYLFYQNGKLLNERYKYELVFRNMSGRYTCSAKNRIVDAYMDSSNFQDISIRYPPRSVTITPSNDKFYTNARGKPLHNITCEAECLPKCTYKWFRQRYSKPYTNGNILFATEYYDSLSLGLSNKFVCRASNNIDQQSYKDSRWITVEVKNGPDNVEIINSSLPVKENGTFALTCVAICYHGCHSYSWYHNSTSMNQSAPILTFHNMSKGDSGKYQCKVTDYFGEKSGYYTVYVQYGPKSVTIQYSTYYPSLDKYLIEGKDCISITCKADCFPECTYLFYQNGKLLNNTYINKLVHRNMSGRYTCVAKNSILNTYKNSSNFEDINIKYKPNISSDVDQRTITAPGLLDLTFIVDSFPSSNVTMFHETKRLTLIPNVNGQLSFNVSCLDRGKYRVEAVNDVGSDSFTFIADVECSPFVVRYSNVSHKKFRVGDLLHLTVAFMANPTAEVLWSFVPWNKNTSLEVQRHQIQYHIESTKIVLILSDTDKFGKYRLELKNKLGKISKEFDIQGPSPTLAATKTDLGIKTTISSRDSDSDGDLSMSPTSWKGKASALRETEMNTFLLQQDKLHEEVQKLRLEGVVLRLKRNYYVIKLQLLMKEHPSVMDEVFGED